MASSVLHSCSAAPIAAHHCCFRESGTPSIRSCSPCRPTILPSVATPVIAAHCCSLPAIGRREHFGPRSVYLPRNHYQPISVDLRGSGVCRRSGSPHHPVVCPPGIQSACCPVYLAPGKTEPGHHGTTSPSRPPLVHQEHLLPHRRGWWRGRRLLPPVPCTPTSRRRCRQTGC